MEVKIKGFDSYTVDEYGNVYSYKSGERKQLKAWACTNGYEEVKLINNEGIKKHRLIHRLVAEAYVENPNGYNVVNHKDKNIKNNYYTNLEWCSTQYNVNYSYTDGNGPVRNFRECLLIEESTGIIIGEFQSIKSASRYANQFLGCSESGMNRNLKSKGYKLVRNTDVTTN